MTNDTTEDQAASDETNAQAAASGNDKTDNKGTQTDGDNNAINNPEAFYKAQAEKNERLFQKGETTIAALKAEMETLHLSHRDQMQKSIDAVTKELEESKAQAAADGLTAMRIKALAAAKLDPESDLEFITATDEAGIKTQVDKLAARTPASGKSGSSRIGNSGGEGQGKSLGWLPGHPDYQKSSGFGRSPDKD